MIAKLELLELESYLQARHARLPNITVSHLQLRPALFHYLILFIQHILRVSRRVDLGSRNIVSRNPGVQERVPADLGVGIQRSGPIGKKVHAPSKISIVKITLRIDVPPHSQLTQLALFERLGKDAPRAS
jgi:hypothetical protein